MNKNIYCIRCEYGELELYRYIINLNKFVYILHFDETIYLSKWLSQIRAYNVV